MGFKPPRKRLRLGGWAGVAAPIAGRLISSGARRLMQKFRNRRPSKAGSKTGTSNSVATLTAPLTVQSDYQRIYRRRAAPRRVRRRATQFFRRSLRVQSSIHPDTLFTFPFKVNLVTLVNQQNFVWFPIYSGLVDTPGAVNAADVALNSQLSVIFASQQTAPAAVTTEMSLLFSDCYATLNIHGDVANTTISTVDVYHLWSRRDSGLTAGANFIRGILEKGTAPIPGTLPVGAVAMTANTLGTTPFNSPDLCKSFIIKSVTQYRVNAGNFVRLVMKDRHEYLIKQDDWAGATIVGGVPQGVPTMQKYTEGFFVVFKGGPDFVNEANPITMEFDWTVQYKYQRLQRNLANATVFRQSF